MFNTRAIILDSTNKNSPTLVGRRMPQMSPVNPFDEITNVICSSLNLSESTFRRGLNCQKTMMNTITVTKKVHFSKPCLIFSIEKNTRVNRYFFNLPIYSFAIFLRTLSC